MPTSTIVMVCLWCGVAILCLLGLGTMFGFLFGMAIAMFAFPAVLAFKAAFPDAARTYYEAFGPDYALLAPVYAALGLGVALILVGYVRYGASGKGVASLNAGVNLAGLMIILLISADMAAKNFHG